jgi:hypothetical protein
MQCLVITMSLPMQFSNCNSNVDKSGGLGKCHIELVMGKKEAMVGISQQA